MKNQTKTDPSEETLFSGSSAQDAPLSVRMRPRTLEEYVGQGHILGEDKLLPRAIEADRMTSIILYGPPGVGKTTLAQCIRNKTRSAFERINAVSANVEDVRKTIAASKNRFEMSCSKTVLFIDEIHRFNKSQQDVLLPVLEEGYLILIGATVMNPFFSLISALLSRSMVFELQSLSEQNLEKILRGALADKDRGLGNMDIHISEDALTFLCKASDGDARRALNALEIGALTTKPVKGKISIDITIAQESIQKKQVVYDRDGDAHYDTASAFIKSMRGTDPDATLYWLAKMIYAGEDPRFIARRICICAAEDVGNADPQALVLANAAMQTADFIGFPEARIPLAQAAVYVACAPKSNASYKAIDQAIDDVKNNRIQDVPNHLKDTHYSGAKKLNRGKDYKYAHSFEGNYVDQDYMMKKIQYYFPTNNGYESKIKARLENIRKMADLPVPPTNN